MEKLTLKIIESFNLPKRSYKPDYDDNGYEFTLPNGIVLEGLFMCNNEPTEMDMLEGLDGWICIETEDELKELISMTYGQVINKIAEEHDDFHLNDYIE